MGLVSPTHILFVVVVALLVFGPKRLPEMARSLGHGLREFKDVMDGSSLDEREHTPARTRPELPPAAPRPAPPHVPTGMREGGSGVYR